MELIPVNVLRSCADGVGWITLNRPDAMNAVTVELSCELYRATGNSATIPPSM